MVQKTDLNVAPYYDDHSGANNYVRTLFRPGFAIQARELTQLQTQLQHQIEQHGTYMFREGSMVIPGAISYNNKYYSLKLATTFAGETVDPSQYYNATNPVTITGATTGVTAKVIGFAAATATDQPTLFLSYEKTGTDNATVVFADGENISASAGITHTSTYATSAASATTFTSEFSVAKGSTTAQLQGSLGPAAATGSAAIIQSGVYYIRGFFVECSEETLVIEKYSTESSYLIGFTVTENIVTPEGTSSLLDNATGSTNFAAKGAHRLQLSLALTKYARDATIPTNFIQLLDVKQDKVLAKVEREDLNILGKTLARRTADESGDYTVRPFNIVVRETTDLNEEVGVYTANDTTDDGNTATNDLLTLQVSTGKAYVKGYEVEKISPTFKDLNKSRDFATVNSGVTQFDLGNFVTVDNVYGTPDITFITDESTAFKTVALYPDPTSTRGSLPTNDVGGAGAGTSPAIGQCRIRAFEPTGSTDSIGDVKSQYKAYLFDIRMFTYITLSDNPSPTLTANFTQGAKITGVQSGATGFVVNNSDINATTTGSQLVVMKTSGRFSNGETFKVSDSTESDKIVENAAGDDITMIAANGEDADNTHTFQQVKSIMMLDSTAAHNFTADIVLTEFKNTTDQKQSLVINSITGGTQDGRVIIGADEAGDAAAYSTGLMGSGAGGIILEGGTTVNFANLVDTDKVNLLEKLPKNAIKRTTTAANVAAGTRDTQYTIRRQFIGTTDGDGVVSFTTSGSETFAAHAEKDYVMSILTAGDGSGVAGDLVSVSGKVTGTGTVQITITDNTILGDSAKVKLIATILKTNVVPKTKTTVLMKQVAVRNTYKNYGTQTSDKEISLGRADAFKLVAVYDSQDTTVDAVAPTMTVSSVVGTFELGEKITGGTSTATGRLIGTASPFGFVQSTTISFAAGETITGQTSGATATIDSLTVGDTVLTSRYLLDTGQRDSYYDIARIVRKSGRSAPIGRMLIIFDYFEHGAGDMFTVESYTDVAKQMEYDDIPKYTASKIDTEDKDPSGEFPLQDTYDFRPRVEDVTGASTVQSSVDEISGNSFNFFERGFSAQGGSTVDIPKPGSFIQSDFEYYLPKFASLILTSEGNFEIIESPSAELPQLPKTPDDSMLIATMAVPAYTFTPQDITIRRVNHRRYTMRDIGKIAGRLDNIEYSTALSLLERDAESFEVLDIFGRNRFKSGFMVDNFQGHRVGDVAHRDYNNSMDIQNGELRPAHRSKGINLIEDTTIDSVRTSRGYQKTGDLITLPYTNEVVLDQPLATRLERVNPFLTATWIGQVNLTPSSDTWFETDVLPDLIINKEGDYDAVLARERNNLGTVWNAWQTQWSGVVETTTETFFEFGQVDALGGLNRIFRPGGPRFTTRTTNSVRTDQSRTGVSTSVALRVDRDNQGEKVLSVVAIPTMRAVTIKFSGGGFKPNTRLYPFFNKRDVSQFCYPFADQTEGGAEPAASTLVQGTDIVTDAAGNAKGRFHLPDPKVAGNPQFSTGEIEFKLTSSSTNKTVGSATAPGTVGTAIFSAVGLLTTKQTTIIATRNAEVTRTDVDESTSFTTQQTSSSSVRVDPVAQTFSIPTETDTLGPSGRFITSVDIFFGAKDANVPVTMEIRNVVNGYPGPKLIPFGRVIKPAADINVDSTSATATTFTFPSPVYVETNTEYCIVLISYTPEHKVWIAQMGEDDIVSGNSVQDQPAWGILFKSHNNTGWAISPMEDLKYTLKCASFTTGSTGTCTLTNDDVPVAALGEDPIVITDGNTAIQVKHQDHHMYDVVNNVTIDKVSSGLTTTLNGSISATQTTLTLTSGTNFGNTSGIYSNNADGFWFIKIGDEVMKYSVIGGTSVSGILRAQEGTAVAHADGATVEFYQVYRVPLTEINKTHTAVGNTGIDSYTVTSTTTPIVDGATALVNGTISSTTALVVDGNKGTIAVGMAVSGVGVGSGVTVATVTDQNNLVLSSAQSISNDVVLTFSEGGVVQVGGTTATATENALMDYFSTNIETLALPKTAITANALVTTGTSPSGSQSSYLNTRNDESISPIDFALNDNYELDKPYIIASAINETNELSGRKSLEVRLNMSTTDAALSPIIDTGRMGIIAVANRLDNIDSSSDVYPTTDYVSSNENEGDSNTAIYLTKQVSLAQSATSLKVIVDVHKPSTSDVKVLFKLLRTDTAVDFDDLAFEFFNPNSPQGAGSPDIAVPPATTRGSFVEHVYSAGVTDEDSTSQLDEFSGFQIKIVMQGTNCAAPPRLKDLRILALAT